MKNQENVNEVGKVTRWLMGASIERSALRCSDDGNFELTRFLDVLEKSCIQRTTKKGG
jgi:hypothetical protein